MILINFLRIYHKKHQKAHFTPVNFLEVKTLKNYQQSKKNKKMIFSEIKMTLEIDFTKKTHSFLKNQILIAVITLEVY